MQPNSQPVPPAVTALDITRIQKTNKLKTTWGIICLIAPTALIIVSVLVYAILNFIAGSQETTPIASDSLFADTRPSPLHTISNVLLFLVGAVSVMTWLPGIIVGIILLATRQKV